MNDTDEFDARKNNRMEIQNAGLREARMLSGSKSGYCTIHPDGEPVFNANIISKAAGCKVWHGDLDLKLDDEKLQQVAEAIGEFCVLREHDARFGSENESYEVLKSKAVKVYGQVHEITDQQLLDYVRELVLEDDTVDINCQRY